MSTKTRTITGKSKAWFTNSAYGPEDLGRDPDRVVSAVLSYSKDDMTPYGWSLAGEAEITITIPDQQTLVENKVESLRAEKKKLQAETQAKVTAIESQIQKLLAITFDGDAS